MHVPNQAALGDGLLRRLVSSDDLNTLRIERSAKLRLDEGGFANAAD